jgi:predicted PurR-regulated permease PerM
MDPDRGAELLLLSLAAVLTLLLLLPFRSPILGAILLAYLLQWPYGLLEPRIGSRPAAVALVLVTVVLFVVPFVLLVTIAITGLRDLLGTFRGDEGATSLEMLLDTVFATDLELGTSLRSLVQNGQLGDLVPVLVDAVGGFGTAAAQLTVFLFLFYYLLRQGDDLLAWISDVAPLRPAVWADLLRRVDRLMYAVVVGNVLIAVGNGLLVGLGLFVVGFSDVLFWTVMSIFLALIPLIGTTVVWIPAAVYLALTGNVVAGVGLFLYGAVIVGAVDNVLRPFLGAPEAGLDPAIFVIGVFAGLAFLGVLGVFYGPILLAMAKIVYEEIDLSSRGAPGTD